MPKTMLGICGRCRKLRKLIDTAFPPAVCRKCKGKHLCTRHKHHPKDGPCIQGIQLPVGPG